MILSLVLLALTLASSVFPNRRVPEVVVAIPAALLVLAVGAVSWNRASEAVTELFPVVAFLAAALVLSEACRREGLFVAAGVLLQRFSRGSSSRLFAMTFLMAGLVTAVLSLDATVVLLTPVVLHAARKALVSARPHLYATGHLANSASLLLPVSNLTNLLAYQQSGLTFLSFAGYMVLPWLVVIAVEFVVLRLYFRKDFADDGEAEVVEPKPIPWFAATVVVFVLLGFVVTSPFGIEPAWVAGVGALVMAVRLLMRKQMSAVEVAKSMNLSFCAFVLALGVIVDAAADTGLNDFLQTLLPDGTGLLALLAIAGVSALLANIVNNLPATLLLLPLVAPLGPIALLAVLIGVNVGPNLTYVGSLATLLWRRILLVDDEKVNVPTFTAVGVLTVVPSILAATTALWLVAQI